MFNCKKSHSVHILITILYSYQECHMFCTKKKYWLTSRISISSSDVSHKCYKKQRQTKGPYTLITSFYKSDWSIHSAGEGRSDSALCKIYNKTWMHHVACNFNMGILIITFTKLILRLGLKNKGQKKGRNNNNNNNNNKRPWLWCH